MKSLLSNPDASAHSVRVNAITSSTQEARKHIYIDKYSGAVEPPIAHKHCMQQWESPTLLLILNAYEGRYLHLLSQTQDLQVARCPTASK
jgi:hypothetical protein